MIVPASVPTTADQISAQYGISVDDFAKMPANIRALFRAAYACDVLHVKEGAAYDIATGEFTPGPPYNNVGPDVNRYLEAVGAKPGEPWCIAFDSCMLLDSGVARMKLPAGAASTHAWLAWAKEHGFLLSAPVRGCLGIIIESPTAGHGVLVSQADVDARTLDTIEGNTNEGGSREGYEVARRTRPWHEFAGFVDLARVCE